MLKNFYAKFANAFDSCMIAIVFAQANESNTAIKMLKA